MEVCVLIVGTWNLWLNEVLDVQVEGKCSSPGWVLALLPFSPLVLLHQRPQGLTLYVSHTFSWLPPTMNSGVGEGAVEDLWRPLVTRPSFCGPVTAGSEACLLPYPANLLGRVSPKAFCSGSLMRGLCSPQILTNLVHPCLAMRPELSSGLDFGALA